MCLLALCLTLLSCKKFLEEKPLKEQFLPSTTEDLQALLDNPGNTDSDPALLEILSDEYYITPAYWQGLSADLALNYTWSLNDVPYDPSWALPYQRPIYYSNIVLDHLATLKLPDDTKSREIKGTALFYRANAFFNLAQLFAKPYDESTLSDLGIVLRTTSDINEKSKRATIKETYDKIISDLNEAANLLPKATEAPTRPTKAAVYAVLSRVYLTMRDYNNTLKYADLALQKHNMLLDFNNLVPGIPFNIFNAEVIFHSRASVTSILSTSNAKIDPALLSIYNQFDLRKTILFKPNTGVNTGTFGFRGSYFGTEGPWLVFTGTATSEMFLIRAECYARKGEKEKAVSDLNTLLAKRMDKNHWIPIDPSVVNEPLALVLAERRKELVFRGLRWMDVRRLNMEGANITLKRVINGTEYSLLPNNNRWVALIPYDVISRSGIQQNPR